MKQRLAASAILVAAGLSLAWGAPLSKAEKQRIQQQIGERAAKDDWRSVGPLLEELAEANDKTTFKFMVKVVEKSPAEAELAGSLVVGAERMDDRRVQDEVRKTALRAKSAAIRQALIDWLAEQGDHETLMKAIKDDDDGVAGSAIWKLAEDRVEGAVEPLIALMEKHDNDQGGAWYACRAGLTSLFRKRCNSGVEFRSLWMLTQEKGGLSSVDASASIDHGDGGAGGSVTLFGRGIDCREVVFILDTSGSMKSVDAIQKNPLGGSRTRGGDSSEEGPGGLTRLERAKIALNEVLDKLPESHEINLITYDTTVKMWRRGEGDSPELHELNSDNRASAKAFIATSGSDGVTVTHEALAQAFTVEGAKCFYLLSDGFATTDGTEKGRVSTERILGIISSAGKGRGVTIHTMGFVGADKAMMEAVADRTGGRYTDIE